MDNRKIAFIITYNNDEIYKNQIKYIHNLYVPNGYKIDIVKINNKEKGINVVENYNSIIQENNAKFKVYLNEDITIINKNFIKNILEIFNKDKKIGIIGIKGSKKLPASINFEDSLEKYGKTYGCTKGSMEYESYNEIICDYENVQVIYGGIFVTQYDIPWRSDIFTSIYFSSIAQCLEFETSGYKTVVPEQKEPWCIDDSKNNVNKEDYKLEKEIFLKEYSKKIFPLVSILIPTYNRPEYFELALQSAINQTYKNIEIIIGDDSTNFETEILIKYYINNYDNIIYYHNEENLGQFDNDIKLYNMAKGEFINYLMDDDLFEEEKIEKMMNYFIQDNNEEISIVTSQRAIIDGNGVKKEVFGEMDRFIKDTSIIPGLALGNFMLKANCNCIGEPTTAIFRKNKLKEPFGTFNKRKYGCNVDQASWLNLLEKNKCVYIAETLSYFRIHDEQQLNSNKMKLLGAIDYSHSILTSRSKGFLKGEKEYFKALHKGTRYCKQIYCEIENSEDKDKFEFEIQQLKENCELMQNEFFKLRKDNEHHTENKLPLVSILIPTHNRPEYFKIALESAINQTYENIEIIVSDNSDTCDIKNIIKDYLYKYDNIYYSYDSNLDAGDNHLKCLKQAKGEYINFLMDDDVFEKTKIEKMMEYYIKYPQVSVVTSYRQAIDENGNKLPDIPATRKLYQKDVIIPGKVISKFVLTNLINVIGEPTTVLYKRKYYYRSIKLNNELITANGDIARSLVALKDGECAYISEPLSYFRIHNNQSQKNLKVRNRCIIDWYNIIVDFYKNSNVYDDRSEYIKSLKLWNRTLASYLLECIDSDIENKDKIDEIASKSLKEILNL